MEKRTLIVLALLSLMSFINMASAESLMLNKTKNQWQNRIHKATENLTNPNLDSCDKAIESAFKTVTSQSNRGLDYYDLKIQISAQTMKIAYIYNGINLNSFAIMALPSNWVATQSPNSKTLSILVPSSNCAFDLCTNNPFSNGACE